MAFRTQKISQMTPKGANLEATDLIEVSTIESGSYVTRSITGQEIIDAIPVPPSGITIGSTAIASGVVGRVLFEGAGNVVQESSSLFWDNTNARLGIGTSSPTFALDAVAPQFGGFRFTASDATFLRLDTTTTNFQISQSNTQTTLTTSHYGPLYFINYGGAQTRLSLFANGNFAIGTTTDAGFRLDVNGTARVQGGLTVANTGNYAITASKGATTGLGSQYFNNGGTLYWGVNDSSGSFLLGTNGLAYSAFFTSTTSALQLGTNATARLTIFPTTGNVGINTTTDAGFRLDVNGTARVQSTTTIGTSAFSSSSNLLTLISDQGSFSMRVGGGSQLLCSAGITSSTFQSNDFVQCVRVLVGSSARLNGGTLDWLSITNWAQSSLGSGNVSANLATFGTAYATINASAQVEIASTTKGFLPPRMTTTQKNAIATPAAGLMVYDTTLNVISYYNGSMWI